MACCEILNATDSVKAMIRDDKVHLINSSMQTGKQFGMQTMDQELARLVKEKVISLETAYDKCINPQELRRFLAAN